MSSNDSVYVGQGVLVDEVLKPAFAMCMQVYQPAAYQAP